MNLRNLLTFIEIVRKGGFYRAAQSLGYAQATVSQQIQQLERELDVALFERYGKRISISAAGRALFDQAVDLTDRAHVLENTMREFGAGDGGVLRIGASEPMASQSVAPLLRSFRESRPHLRIVFEVSSAQTQAELVAAGKLDLACSAPSCGCLNLHFEPLFDEELRVLVPINHPAANKAAISLDEICADQLVLTESECAYRQVFEDTARQRGAVPKPAMQVTGSAAAVAAVESGLGIAILPRTMAVNSSRVIVKRLAGIRLFLPIGIITRSDAILPPCARQFIEALRKRLTAQRQPEAIAV